MIQKLRFAEFRLAETSAKSLGTAEDRLPVGAAVVVIAGANVALWLLIAIVLRNLF